MTMHPTIQQLLNDSPVLLDGAWGTELQRRGLAAGACPDAMNLNQPSVVFEVARSYAEAGSQLILTNTFGANRFRLAAYQLADQTKEINRRGAQISKQAAGSSVKVFGSIGPSGKMLLTGEVTVKELEAAFREQAEALAEGGVDGLVIETMSDLEEAQAALRAARSTGLPVVVCMVFDAGKNKDRTMMGHTPEQVAQVLTEAGADVVGANCGQGIAGFIPICQRMRTATALPLWMKPNAGLPEMEGDRVVYRTTPQEFASYVPELVKAGASFVGGCCGTTPEFIRHIAAVLEKTQNNNQ